MAKKNDYPPVTVIGGGLAGIEAVYQLIRRSIPVTLVEMRPNVMTGAHKTDRFAELVCSNSMGSNLPDRASGLLKEEMRNIGSYILDVAYKYRVPAGNALAVDREAFSREITRYIKGHNLVTLKTEEATSIPDEGYVILATGPLTSEKLLKELSGIFDAKHLFFFDAVAPIVKADTIDMEYAFKADRYGEDGEGDYINCPLSQSEYQSFVEAVLKAGQIKLHTFEKEGRKKFFSACQPIEQIASSGPDSLRFGPMKPVGLVDPRTGHRPWAVVQLRKDNLLASLYNIVGFQNNMVYPEQERVFRMIPALRNAEFVRFGQMHLNSYLNSPKILIETLQVANRETLFIAGQLSGVEGYTESLSTGLIAGFNLSRIIKGKLPVVPPPESMIGALIAYITFKGHKNFTPMNANFGLFQSLTYDEKSEVKKNKIVSEARKAFRRFMLNLKSN